MARLKGAISYFAKRNGKRCGTKIRSRERCLTAQKQECRGNVKSFILASQVATLKPVSVGGESLACEVRQARGNG